MGGSVVVVGAGIAGLGAAHDLARRGHDVRVLEAEAEVGGRMRSTSWQGTYIDLGAEFIASPGIPDELLAELGILATRRQYPGGKVAPMILRDGHAHVFDYTDPTGVLRYTGMSRAARLRLVGLLPAMVRQMLRSRGAELWEVWRGAWADDESLQTWLSRISPEFLEYAMEPFFELYCGWEPHAFSKGAFLATMTEPRLPEIHTWPEGLGTVTRALAERVDVATGARVRRVDLDAKPVRVEYTVDERDEVLEADIVLLAVPGSRVLGFTEGLDEERIRFFRRVEYVPHELPFFTVSRPPEGVPSPGVFIPRREDPDLAGVFYGPSSTSDDVSFLRISMKTPAVRRNLDTPDDEWAERILDTAARHYPDVRNVVTGHRIQRWREGLPSFPPGSIRRIADFVAMPPQRGVAFCGDYLATGATSAAYVSGFRAAREVDARLGAGGV